MIRDVNEFPPGAKLTPVGEIPLTALTVEEKKALFEILRAYYVRQGAKSDDICGVQVESLTGCFVRNPKEPDPNQAPMIPMIRQPRIAPGSCVLRQTTGNQEQPRVKQQTGIDMRPQRPVNRGSAVGPVKPPAPKAPLMPDPEPIPDDLDEDKDRGKLRSDGKVPVPQELAGLVEDVIGNRDPYYCTKCERDHKPGSKVWKDHKEFAKVE